MALPSGICALNCVDVIVIYNPMSHGLAQWTCGLNSE